MIDISEFNDKKEKGLARILEKTDKRIIVVYKQFDLEQARLGVLSEMPEEVYSQSIEELNEKKIMLQKQITDIDMFLAIESNPIEVK